ncbi:MAG: 3-mercaptopyruvate sulfurtransferase [Rhodospirillales bacterium]|nr:3-mercaptopyruvate sulfurtransferase [Rhodospirillales bacterium]
MPDRTSASPLVSAEWLRDAYERPDVVVLDASWHMPATRRDGASEFELGHIPGSAFFSIDGIADPDSTLPHMVPTAEAFAAAVGGLGASAGDHVVCYATDGIGTAPRAWWMFRLFGHERVSVLDGGLPAWTAVGGTLVKGPARPRPRAFQAKLNPARIRDLAAVRANLQAATELVVDARSAGRFAGTEAEPRSGLRGGHIPGSVNLPYQTLLNGPRMLPLEALRARLDAAGVADDRPPVFTCGSGVSACTLALGLTLTGRDDWAVYDGSWSEWGGREDVPVTP